MGKASRRKHAEEQQRLYFDIKGDVRNAADRAKSRAMLDALQQKLVDDALREDDLHPSIAIFDIDTARFRSQDERGPHWDFGVGHQQQIMTMSFSHGCDDPLLATGSLDSTSIIWRVAPDDTKPSLTMLMILPVADAGVASCVFTSDDQELVTLGSDGVLKVWRVDDDTSAQCLHHQHKEWELATPFTLSFSHTQDLLLFGDTLPSFHGNDEWLVHNRRQNVHKMDTLQTTISANDSKEIAPTKTSTTEEDDCGNQQIDKDEEKVMTQVTMLVRDTAVDSQIANDQDNIVAVNRELPASATDSIVDADNNQDNHIAVNEEPPATATDSLGDSLEGRDIVDEAIDAVERLRREYEKMDSFDFERMLNPATPVLSSTTDAALVKTIQWPVLTPDASDRLLRTFTRRKANGDFASHTSHVTGCAVAKEVDLVTTVAYDKSVICWSMSLGNVRSITRDAHSAPITSCALTSPTTSQPPDLPLLLATAAKDNLVKVWRFDSLEKCTLEAVYSLSGHYDAITALSFDASGVFLVSASDDTLTHCWRVRPAPPDAPPMPVVLNVDRFAITIEWKMPLANGSALTKYVVHTEQLSFLSTDGSDMKIIKDRDVEIKYKSLTVDNLQPGIQYRLCVAAVNGVGQSLWSETTESVETLAFAPSKIEKSVSYRDITPTSVRLSWKAPCPNGAVIASYAIKALPENTMFVPLMETRVQVSELSSITPEPDASRRRHPLKLKSKKAEVVKKAPDTGPSQYEYVLHGLWPGEVYQFVVAAENRCGLGEFSPFSDYIKMESTAPDAPAKPEITNVGKRYADVTWIKPRKNGSEILQYIIEWTQDDTLRDETITATTTVSRSSVTLLTKSILGTTYKITGLRPGRPLCVWVAATNLVNGKLTASPFSEPSDTIQTLPDVPDQPRQPRLESPSSHSIVVAIDPPCDNGARIESYELALFYEEIQFGIVTKKLVRELELRPEDFDSLPDPETNNSSLRITLFKLRAKTFYSATVVATSALGRSSLSESSVAVPTKTAIVPAVIPDAPTIRDVAPTHATIAWASPAHDGGAALASVVLQYSINDGAFEHEIVLFEGSELVLEQLKPRTQYTFRVAAANGVGRAEFSPPCQPFTTPSLVDYTIATYFASRPPLEHAKATVLQRRFRLWKQRKRDQREFLEQLRAVLASSWHLL